MLAALCATVLVTRVSVEFHRIRLRIVNAPLPAVEGSIAVPLPNLTPLAAAPAAVVVRLRGGPSSSAVDIAVDRQRVAHAVIPAHREIRIDAAARLPAGGGHELLLTGDPAGWQLTYLEIANIHGFTSGVVEFVIVPREREREAAIPPWLFLPVLIALVALQPRLDWPRGRVRWLYRTGAAIVFLLFAAALTAEWVTPFRMLLSLHTFVLGAAVLFAEPIARLRAPAEPLVRPVVGAVVTGIRRWGSLLPAIGVTAVFLWSVCQWYEPGVGFTALIKFGDQFSPTAHPNLRHTPHSVETGAGYDGQFYAQLALDPLVRSDSIVVALDSPGYRARRILFPWIAHVVGLGQPWYVLQVYALLNVVSWLAMAWLLLRWLPPRAVRSTLAWCGCLLAEGLLASVRQALVDGPSMLLLALGVMAIERKRRWLGAGILGAASLGRDTNVLGAAALPDSPRTGRDVSVLALQALLVVAPVLLWMGYLSRVGLSVGETGYDNFGLPFAAYVDKWRVTLSELRAEGWWSPARFSFLSLIALSTQLLVLLYLRDGRSPWWRLGMAYAGLLVVLGISVWDGYPGAATRVVLPMTFAFNILLPRVRWFWPLWVLGNANLPAGLWAMNVPWLWNYL